MSYCKSYGLLGRSTVIPAVEEDAADNIDVVDEVVLHKNGQARINMCTST